MTCGLENGRLIEQRILHLKRNCGHVPLRSRKAVCSSAICLPRHLSNGVRVQNLARQFRLGLNQLIIGIPCSLLKIRAGITLLVGFPPAGRIFIWGGAVWIKRLNLSGLWLILPITGNRHVAFRPRHKPIAIFILMIAFRAKYLRFVFCSRNFLTEKISSRHLRRSSSAICNCLRSDRSRVFLSLSLIHYILKGAHNRSLRCRACYKNAFYANPHNRRA